MGYWIDNINGGGENVKSAVSPYILCKFDDKWFSSNKLSSDPSENTPNIADDVVEKTSFYTIGIVTNPNSAGFNAYQHYKLTNASGSTGSIFDLDNLQHWNTLAKIGSANSPNGYDATSQARLNNEALFKDGDYNLNIVMKDLKPAHNQIATQKITVDNFRPFIKKLEICNPIGNPIYTYEWTIDGNNTNLVLTEGGTGLAIDPFYPITINFWSSEPLDDNGIFTRPQVDIGDKPAEYIKNIDGEYWQYSIRENSLLEDDIYAISISAIDLNYNQLFDLPDEIGTIPLSNLPLRDFYGFSNTQNLPDNETLNIVGCYLTQPSIVASKDANLALTGCISSESGCNTPDGSDAVPVSSFSYSLGGTENNIVTFTNNSEFGDYYMWDFGDGQVSYETTPSPHEYPNEYNAINYIASLTVSNSDGESNTYQTFIQIPGENSPEENGLTINCSYIANPVDDGYLNPPYKFSTNLENTNSDYTYQASYDFDDGNTETKSGTSTTVIHWYEDSFSAKTYFPRVFIHEYNGEELVNIYEKQLTGITTLGLPDVELEVEFPNNMKTILTGSELELNAQVSNGLGTHSFVWEIYDNIDGSGSPIDVVYNYDNNPTKSDLNGQGLFLYVAKVK